MLIHISSAASSVSSDSGIPVQSFTASLVIKNDARTYLLSLTSSEQTESPLRSRITRIGHRNDDGRLVKHRKARV